jgi:hypothetical protein
MIQIPILDDYSRRVADAVLERWPEWKSFAKTVKKRSKTYFVLEVPPINPKAKLGIKLIVGSGATGLEFENDRLHVDDYLDEGPNLEDLTVAFIDQYLSEELVSVSWWQRGKLKISTLLEPGKRIPKQTSLKGSAQVRVRSWTGKHDRDLTLQ